MEPTQRATVRLLDVDPDLATAVPEDEFDLAAQNAVAAVMTVQPGPWDACDTAPPGCVGLLLIDGLLTRNVSFAGVGSRELLGAGDLLRPWDVDEELSPLRPESSWTVMEPAALALLDQRFLQIGARWPQLVEEVLSRAMNRSRWLAVRLAIGSITRVHQRLLLFFWYAAGRWGRVGTDGTRVPFDLTHELLGELVGARRPSVTSALGELRDRGELERSSDGWLLRGAPPADVTGA